jgi:ribokinase
VTAKVVVVGSLNMDLVVCAPRIPHPGETVIGGEFYTAAGGKGSNQAVAAARLGAKVHMVGRVGQDELGAQLMETLEEAGVDHQFVVQDPGSSTGVALITVADSGQNSIVVAPGSNMRLSPDDVDAARGAIGEADILLVQLETPLETVTRALQIARAKGVKTILNPAPARTLPRETFGLVDVLIPNETETAVLTGLSVGTQTEAKTAGVALRKQGVKTVVMTLGERGAIYADAGDVNALSAYEVKAVDTTAAGDAFVGAFAVATAEGKSLSEAVRWGNAAGALAVTKRGAQPSLPDRGALEEILALGTIKPDQGE